LGHNLKIWIYHDLTSIPRPGYLQNNGYPLLNVKSPLKSFFSFKVLSLLVSLMLLVQSFPIAPPVLGPNTPEAVFKGKILENGVPVSAHLSLEVLYKVNGEEVPLSLM
jgi:hypothetical protein